MRNRWGREKRVLYHAVSSYQLLEVMLHRMAFHPTEKAELLLPDFITGKYPQYQKLENIFFDKVELFPYLSIPHINRKQILKDTCRYAEGLLSGKLSSYSTVYVAGAHFYFSLYLIQKKKPFVFFEDAAGMLSRPNILYDAIRARYPLHGEIAAEYGFLDGSNPLIWKIICLKKAQTRELQGKKYQNFSVEEALERLPSPKLEQVIHFFLPQKIQSSGAEAVLLTQQFSNQGLLSQEQQFKLYQQLRQETLRNVPLIIKKHPDDHQSYREIFPEAVEIPWVFPAELLPYVLENKPSHLYTWDSTACSNLEHHFIIHQLGGKPYAQ